MAELSGEDRLLIEGACRDLVMRYTVLVDDGRADEVADLFTRDGRWVAPGLELRGRDELREGFARRAQRTDRVSRHVCTNFHLSEVSADHAVGSVYLTLYRHDRADGEAGPVDHTRSAMVGVYRDRFTRTEAGWLIADRRLELDFVADTR
jgi:hypothetical protein